MKICKMKIREIIHYFEELAPTILQESYDNSGLIIGDFENEISKMLICIDITEEVLNEAIQNNCGLIVSHHPIIFKGIKKINNDNYVERIIRKAIKNEINIFALHTNLDNLLNGVNGKIAEKLGLRKVKILQTHKKLFRKLVTFCPIDHANKVREALFKAGAGKVGNYDSCSFNIEGKGTFKANANANPYVGEKNKMHTEKEERIEIIYPSYIENSVINGLYAAHPYEEIAYDIYSLENNMPNVGFGIIGELKNAISETKFLLNIKNIFNAKYMRHTKLLNQRVKRIAICGGSGSFLINEAKKAKADVLISADIKYHDFFEADGEILLIDIGHYESEQFTKELIYDIIIKKIPNFGFKISGIDTNPIIYFNTTK